MTLRRDDRGVSEIVGALMLTLIVVIAASSFAAFLAQKQNQEQQNALLQAARQQESILVQSIQPVRAPGADRWEALNFTLSSLHTDETTLRKVTIDDQVVRSFSVTRFNVTLGNFETVRLGYMDTLKICLLYTSPSPRDS